MSSIDERDRDVNCPDPPEPLSPGGGSPDTGSGANDGMGPPTPDPHGSGGGSNG